MPNYQLEIKQRESYPRCRVNLGFFQSLLANRDIHTNGCPGLFCMRPYAPVSAPERIAFSLPRPALPLTRENGFVR